MPKHLIGIRFWVNSAEILTRLMLLMFAQTIFRHKKEDNETGFSGVDKTKAPSPCRALHCEGRCYLSKLSSEYKSSFIITKWCEDWTHIFSRMQESEPKVLAEIDIAERLIRIGTIYFLNVFQKELIWKQIPLTILEEQRKVSLHV